MKATLKTLTVVLAMLVISAHAWGQASRVVPNATVTGTTLNSLATINTSYQAVIATTSNTAVPTYIVVGGAGTAGSAALAFGGQASCTMDSTIASAAGGYYVIASVTTGGQCHAQSAAPASGVWVVGFLDASAITSGSTALVNVDGYFYGIPAAGISAAIQNLTGCNIATNVLTPQSSNCVAPSGGTALTYLNTKGTLSAGFNLTANFEILFGTVILVPLSVGHMVINVTTADATNSYSFGLFNSSGTAICTTTAAIYSTTGFKVIACSQGTVSIPAGKYYFGVTGNAATLVTAYTANEGMFYPVTVTAIGTTSGIQPASITPPSDSWGNSYPMGFGFAP